MDGATSIKKNERNLFSINATFNPSIFGTSIKYPFQFARNGLAAAREPAIQFSWLLQMRVRCFFLNHHHVRLNLSSSDNLPTNHIFLIYEVQFHR